MLIFASISMLKDSTDPESFILENENKARKNGGEE
ncbi:hypothetical protein N175_00055 [Vibrio anguillarum M3]|nr:hypothetical protein N175_00055 [Vibrio anguillarum M3]